MTAVTISRQLGSLGSQIAFLTAESLEYRLIWRELINRAARQAGAPEAALAAIDDLGLLGICPSPKECQAYRKTVEELMKALADEGRVVIIGRAGQMILREYPDVLHVRIIAPDDLRAERIAERTGVNLECALAQVQASDQNRRKYLRRFYQVRWDDALLYHLVINTGRTSIQQAVEIIINAVRSVNL